MKKTLYIIDIFSFIFRAYYAIRPLHAPDGTQVNAVYGVITMLKRLIDAKKPDHLVVCMESKAKKTFREEIYPEYKANRGAPPEDLRPQIPLIEEFVKTYPMPTLSVGGFEADDLIATLVKRYSHKKDIDIFIVSPDKDLMQLVCENVFLYDTMKEEIMGSDAVVEKFGVPPEKVVEVQSLCGDPTDNIPGIPGVGLKTAAKLIQEYGSIDNVLKNAEHIKGKLGEKIATGKDAALLSQKLVSLDHDVPLDIKWEDLAINGPDATGLNAFFQRLGFRSLVIEETKSTTAPLVAKKDPANFVTIATLTALKDTIADFYKRPGAVFVFDTETDSIDSLKANLVGLSFCFEDKNSYYIPIGHKVGGNLNLDEVRKILAPLFADAGIPKAAQNAKYDLNVLTRHSFDIQGLADDTLIASYLINPEGSHALDTLAMKYLHYNMTAFGDVVKRGQTFADVDLVEATHYSAADAWVTFEILNDLQKELLETEALSVYRDIEMPLITILSKMEQHGLLIDKDLLSSLDKQFTARLAELETDIYKTVGFEFNINSTKQLGDILFNKLNLPVIKKTKTGNSTDVEVLKALAPLHELPKLLLDYRTVSKLKSTYVVGLIELIDPKTNRIHSTFNQAVVATGRLSSTDPNLQNIPIKTPEGRKLRELFIAPPGHVIFSADYSQVELRLLAAFSKDPRLVDAYKHGEDVHRKTAAAIFGIDLKDVTDRQRMVGKTINFGVIYGQSSFGLSQLLGIPREEAKHFIDLFYREFGRVKDYKNEVLVKARQDGFVTSYLGRRRYLPELTSRNKMAQTNAERAAFNAIFQGSAADLIKKAMLLVDDWIREQKLKSKLILQVHDELLFEVPQNELEAVQKYVPHLMATTFTLDVPLEVSFKSGKNWAAAH